MLEVLIAAVIAGIALGVLFLAAAGGLRAGMMANRYADAVSRAKSHLEGASAHLAPGTQEGDDGSGFRWRVQIRAADVFNKSGETPGEVITTASRTVTLYAITVWISLPEGARSRVIRLDSARLATSGPS